MRAMVARLGASVATVGLVILLIGTFLPWLRSGSVLRDSYQSAGALRGLAGAVNAQAGALLTAWPAVIPCCAVCVAGYALGLRRAAAVLGLLIAIPVGAAGGLVAAQGGGGDGLVAAATTGPIVTLVGATFLLVGAIAVVFCPRARSRAKVGGS